MLKNRKTNLLIQLTKYLFRLIQIIIVFSSFVHFLFWVAFHFLVLISLRDGSGKELVVGVFMLLIGDYVWYSLVQIWWSTKKHIKIKTSNYFAMFFGVAIHIAIQIYFYKASQPSVQTIYFSSHHFILNAIFSGLLTCFIFIYYIFRHKPRKSIS
jgi:hypothetical protein